MGYVQAAPSRMEVAAVAGLVGLGYAVSRLAGNSKPKEGFESGYGIFKPGSQTVVNRGPPRKPLGQTPQGANTVGPNPELDLMYHLPYGQTLPATPNPTPYGLPTNYATQTPPLAPPIVTKGPEPVALNVEVPQVIMNGSLEQNPEYVRGDIVSALSGETIPACDFKHNNMVPFYGGSMKQNVNSAANVSRLDMYTGSGDTQIKKQEVETMFNTAQSPYGNPFGLESSTDFIESRVVEPRYKNSERPFEPVRVAPGVGEKGGLLGKGGFQQLEVNELMRPKTTDQLRVATDPKLTYKQPVVPGKHFIGAAADKAGEVRKYRPDRFFVDETNSRAGAAAPVGIVAEAVRPIQVLPHTTRTDTTTEAFGPAQGADTFQSYVTGAYRTPMTQQYGGSGFRNADASTYFTNNVDSPEADYGRSGWENRPNERSTTSKRTMTLNLRPAESGTVPVHYMDNARPTRRAEMEGGTGSGEVGHAVGYAGGAPAATVWDPDDVARTTVKQTTIDLNHFGISASASAPNKLKVYDPNDIARPTQKAQLSNREYTGSGYAPERGVFNEDYAYNMRTNPNKEQIRKGRKPIAGNGGLAVFMGDQGLQTAKRPMADDVNDRANAVNRVTALPPGSGDLGQVKYRVPLHLDVSAERFTPDIVNAVNNNPLMQSLQKNAQLDAARIMAERQTGMA